MAGSAPKHEGYIAVGDRLYISPNFWKWFATGVPVTAEGPEGQVIGAPPAQMVEVEQIQRDGLGVVTFIKVKKV
jgi:hypothetical protein